MSHCCVTTTLKSGGLGVGGGTGIGGGGGGGGGSGGCIRGIEGQIVSHIFKPLVTRFINATRDMKIHDNYVYSPIESATSIFFSIFT